MELAQRDGWYPHDSITGDFSRLASYNITVSTVNTTTGEFTVETAFENPFTGREIVFPSRFIPLSPGYTRYSDAEISNQMQNQNLPAPLVNQLYYIKYAGTSRVAKIYGSLADWTAETNPILFTVDQLRVKCELDTYTTHDLNPSRYTIKAPCRVATTANISLSGLQTIDGVSLIEGDRVLVKNHAATPSRGVYNVSSGAWTRATDYSYGRATTKICDQATNENQVLSGILDTLTGKARIVGGRALAIGRTVLLMNQDDPTENDLWTTASGAWSRNRTLNPASFDITRRLYIQNIVSAGTYRGQWFTINLDVPITIGTTPITIEMVSEPKGIFVDDTYTFILEGTVNKLKGFYQATENVMIGVNGMVFTTSADKFYFDYAFKKYPGINAQLYNNGTTTTFKIPLETLGVADPENIYGYPRYPRVTTPLGLPIIGGTLGTTPQPMPLTLTIHMAAGYLVTAGANFVYDPTFTKIDLGAITETLTYSPAAGAWISDVVNYYEIPGRLIIFNPGQLLQTSIGSVPFIDSRTSLIANPFALGIRFSHQQAARKGPRNRTTYLGVTDSYSIYTANEYLIFNTYDPTDDSYISSL